MKNNSPFFTIISASKNSGSTISYTLESVKNQVFEDVEHIVIDGESDDKTLEILKLYAHDYNLTYISEPDEGIADALNKGVKRANGNYLLVIQADDCLLNPGILKAIYPILKTQKYDIYSFPIILDHPIKGRVLTKPIKFLWYLHFKVTLPHQGCFVHRRVFDKFGGFRKEFSICMDYDFFYRTIFHGCSVAFGELPVAIMGGTGLCSDPRFMSTRLNEERCVQIRNETSLFWKMAQLLFSLCYMPY